MLKKISEHTAILAIQAGYLHLESLTFFNAPSPNKCVLQCCSFSFFKYFNYFEHFTLNRKNQ